MNKPKVYITNSIPKEVLDYIGKHCDYEIWDNEENIQREELKLNLKDKAGIMLTGIKIDEDLLQYAPSLRVVSNIAVGYNNFDIEAMKKRKVIGTNTPYVLDGAVADLIFGLILSTSRRITELDSYIKKGQWKASDDKNLYGTDVHRTTLGIIGMGRIGEAVAKRAKLGFEMKVLYYNRSRKVETEKSLGVKYSDMDNLLEKSDFIVLMTPLTKDTYHLIDAEEFSKMKKTAIFINASRGQTVNEKALIEALENKKILAAGLDVYETEPINKDNPLLKMDNVVTLPHIGSATARTRFDMAMTAAENLVKGVLGEKPKYVVPELEDLI